MCYYPENRLCLIMLFIRRTNPLPSFNLVCCSHNLFQKGKFSILEYWLYYGPASFIMVKIFYLC